MCSMNDVLVTISKVEAALNAMAGVFRRLETDLAAIDTTLKLAFGHASDNKWSFQRNEAGNNLTDGGNKWVKVVDLAKRVQGKGILESTDIHQVLKLKEVPGEKSIEIVSTHYGGTDVTEFSQVLFRYGDSIRIRSIEPGFPDPWDRGNKTITMIHTYDKKDSLFICREHTNFHVLPPGPISGYQGFYHVAVELNPASTRRVGAPIEILAIVYGPEQVTGRNGVLDYVYGAAGNHQPVTFSSDKMGGDTLGRLEKE